jgi:Type VI secretion system (T6SS), amidase effector protein 4
MAVIPVSFESLADNYPARPDLTPELKQFMASTPGTPCCVQVSHSLNMAGETITQTYVGQRRNNSAITINGAVYYYLLAVDELETWLTLRYGAGEDVGLDDSNRRRSPQQIKTNLQGRTGILAFRTSGAGFHTELWDGQQIVQRDMNESACFSQPRVLFWDCGAPQWLQDYMKTQ